ncbi:glyoxylase-like metal-dependent hydrolase (beta-lactamase superfamily II) [Actinoplanes lutulentus]|uniref:Metallo-beta-lactamase superfamily protein n=1 Tax=Actinoplanes lutulentus TaxID=1287878 RepID=A0A327ZG82_9ACTN|nr:MBL fold metallo-hydrolase [Actinoplanes lutulentus]MBB2947259.1 glyoxylase-like metal-dependent hydrolase (beta-lactamase superfamily II) [Actinoplanes lutulentus]RAK36534.1 metallo-beta-lactamase superfamily protein [Actinoplanes lutulentus]
MTDTRIDFNSATPGAGTLDVRWIHGSSSAKHNTDPDIQVHAYNEHTVILRQNKAVDYEAPFMFLLFGNDRVVLLDTGATASAEHFPLRRTVDDLVRRWLEAHPREGYELVVLHTHAHRDHVAADAQFAGRPRTVVVGADRASAWAYLGLTGSNQVVRLDLGGRVLDCLATPGHHESAITFHDPFTGLLFTGDTVYRGRLYIDDWTAFRQTIDTLVEFCETRPVTHVLGCHIEMTDEPGVDYPVRTSFQPDETPLQMTAGHLRDIQAAVAEVGDRTGRHVFDDFILCRDGA